ncbi:unnamed protein product [Umbelopsis ramanniana]
MTILADKGVEKALKSGGLSIVENEPMEQTRLRYKEWLHHLTDYAQRHESLQRYSKICNTLLHKEATEKTSKFSWKQGLDRALDKLQDVFSITVLTRESLPHFFAL